MGSADRLKRELSMARRDTAMVLILLDLSEAYRGEHPDTTLYYGQQALSLSREINFPVGELRAQLAISGYFRGYGNLPKALEVGLQALEIAKKYNLRTDQAFAMIRIGNIYMDLKDFREAVNYFQKANKLVDDNTHPFFYAVTFWRSADGYASLNMLDSAAYMAKIAYDKGVKMNNKTVQAGALRALGNIYARSGDERLAFQYFHQTIDAFKTMKSYALLADTYNDLSTFYRNTGRRDSAIFYAKEAIELAVPRSMRETELRSAVLLSELFESSQPAEALKYLKLANVARDSIYSAEKVQALQKLSMEEKQRQVELQMARVAYQNQMRQFGLLAGIGLLLLITISLYRNNLTKQKANKLLENQKNKIESTLTALKATQSQLIQSEKMASLGELTAGIAHEIQNPLNFVNNFSEVNADLIDDLKNSLKSGDNLSAEEIADTLKANQEKINNHGKRAEGIVKSMLQHSRTSSGQKELTDINALCDEYLRLAYHGFRAKDKSFNANCNTNLDSTIPKLNVIPQDIGRVILNLINNAFYAVGERSAFAKAWADKASFAKAWADKADKEYQPTVSVSTKRLHDKVEIRIQDNGAGISDAIKEKIFQPFFTTKPTGQGTGLGLSLAFDIITKGHGGELKVESKEGESCEFIIRLPLSQNA
jgi:two-component system NtrC family sensor kinase